MFVWKLKISLVAWSIVFCFKEIIAGLEGWKLASPSTTSENTPPLQIIVTFLLQSYYFCL